MTTLFTVLTVIGGTILLVQMLATFFGFLIQVVEDREWSSVLFLIGLVLLFLGIAGHIILKYHG